MLRTTVIDHPGGLRRLRSLWDELHAAGRATMFQSFAWNETAARVFAVREPARIIVSVSDAGAVIMPSCVTQTGVALLGETLFDYRDALGNDPSLIAVCVAKLSEWDKSLQVTSLRSGAIQHWPRLRTEAFANAPAILQASISAEDFLRTQNRLGRHSRRLRKQGIELRRHGRNSTALIREIYCRKGAQGTPTSNLFADPLRREFMESICAHEDAHCEVFTYETAGELVAALVTFRDGSWRRFYTVYYDQRWASYSPGQVLLFEVAAESLAAGLDCDFMTGEYPYKLRLATDLIPLYRVSATAEELRAFSRARLTPSIAA